MKNHKSKILPWSLRGWRVLPRLRFSEIPLVRRRESRRAEGVRVCRLKAFEDGSFIYKMWKQIVKCIPFQQKFKSLLILVHSDTGFIEFQKRWENLLNNHLFYYSKILKEIFQRYFSLHSETWIQSWHIVVTLTTEKSEMNWCHDICVYF